MCDYLYINMKNKNKLFIISINTLFNINKSSTALSKKYKNELKIRYFIYLNNVIL